MKVLRKYRYLLLIFAVLFFRYPYFPMMGEVQRVEIQYRSAKLKNGEYEFVDKKFILSESAEIQEVKDKIGIVWQSIFPINSHEGAKSWMLYIHRRDGSSSKLYIDNDEVGNGNVIGRSQLLEYLNGKFT